MSDPENTLILETSKGNVTIDLRPDLAPGHVARIKELEADLEANVTYYLVVDLFSAASTDGSVTITRQ